MIYEKIMPIILVKKSKYLRFVNTLCPILGGLVENDYLCRTKKKQLDDEEKSDFMFVCGDAGGAGVRTATDTAAWASVYAAARASVDAAPLAGKARGLFRRLHHRPEEQRIEEKILGIPARLAPDRTLRVWRERTAVG